MTKKVLLLIRDGWGYREMCEQNAICQWKTLFTDELMMDYPNILLDASGEAVGLPKWYMGNSEVGHMAIGSGRIIFQSLARINKSIEEWSFFKIKEFTDSINFCKKNGTKLHLISLLQTQWVHAHIDHLFALLDLCVRYDFRDVVIHVITDGRDAPVTESLIHIKKLEDKLKQIWCGEIVTISWRFYAMDRDKRWDRTIKAYRCIAEWIVEDWKKMEFYDAIDMVKWCHKNEEMDEFILPRKNKNYDWVEENDAIIFINFRTDRTRQLTQSFVEKDFYGFDRLRKNIKFVAMTQYYRPMNADVAFCDFSFENLLWDVVSKNWYRQLRISETEKYAHVTFFFNGQREKVFENEDRVLIDSPKVKTYDLKPEMSVYELKDKLVFELNKNKYQLIVTNFVNGDMVGHTWISKAIEKAVYAVDECVKETVKIALENNYDILVFADHGNAEDQTEEWRTSHTTNPVPCIYISKDKNVKLKNGKWLQDIAPTVLDLMWIDKPKEMTGDSILIANL